ncbi:hypothetical protein [Streptomyces sp. NPDC059874]
MVGETRSWGVDLPPAVADGGYGDTAAFHLGLKRRARPEAVVR